MCVHRSIYRYVGRCLVDDAVLRLDAPLPASWLLLGKFPLVGKHLQQQRPAVEPAISHSTFCRTRTTSAGARCKITRLAGLIPFHTLYSSKNYKQSSSILHFVSYSFSITPSGQKRSCIPHPVFHCCATSSLGWNIILPSREIQ